MPDTFDDERPQEESVDTDLLLEAQTEAALILGKHLPSAKVYDEIGPGNSLAERLRLELSIIDNNDRKENSIPTIGRERFACRIIISINLDDTEERDSAVGRHTKRNIERIRIDDSIAFRVVSSLSSENKTLLAEHFFPRAVDDFKAHLEKAGLIEHVESVSRQLHNVYFELIGEEMDS